MSAGGGQRVPRVPLFVKRVKAILAHYSFKRCGEESKKGFIQCSSNRSDVFYIFHVGTLSKCQGFAYGSSEGVDLFKHSGRSVGLNEIFE